MGCGERFNHSSPADAEMGSDNEPFWDKSLTPWTNALLVFPRRRLSIFCVDGMQKKPSDRCAEDR